MSKLCDCFQPEHSGVIYLKAGYQMHGLISVLFCQSQSCEEQDQSDGEWDTEKTCTGVRGIIRVPSI